MASYLAIASTCEALVRLLRASYVPADFHGPRLEFQVYVAEDFKNPMNQGVSVFVYRVYHNQDHRTPYGLPLPNGRRQGSRLSIDVHFLLTAWGKTAGLQHEIAAWMMLVMETHAILGSGLLNASQPGVFRPDESVEVVPTQLSVDDMFQMWDVMINEVYQISVPYVARMLQLDSDSGAPSVERVQQRAARFSAGTQSGNGPAVGSLP